MSACWAMVLANEGPLPMIIIDLSSLLLSIGVTWEGQGCRAILTDDFTVSDRLEMKRDMESAFMCIIIFAKLWKKTGIAGRFS